MLIKFLNKNMRGLVVSKEEKEKKNDLLLWLFR